VLWALARILLGAANLFITPIDQHGMIGTACRFLIGEFNSHRRLLLWAVGGLILGGVTHSVLDSFVTRAKRLW